LLIKNQINLKQDFRGLIISRDKSFAHCAKEIGLSVSLLINNPCSDKQILPAFLSLGGLTPDALQFCQAQGIGTAYRIEHF
jgi:hypothetical protein